MNANKTNIYTTFDTAYETWNVVDMNNQCLFYGSIDELENWLDENKGRYQEQLH